MLTTWPVKSLWALVFTAAFLAVAPLAHAQSRGKDYTWPTTFRGQPEFEFKRDTVLKDTSNKLTAGRGKTVRDSGAIPTMALLIKKEISDPFIEDDKRAAPLPIPELKLNIEVPEIPDINVEEQLNLDEFKNYLDSLVNAASTAPTVDVSEKDLHEALGQVVISSMMTSPSPYVIINKQKFTEGDRFLLPVASAQQVDDHVEQMIDAQMPNKDSVSEKAYAQYQSLRDDAIRSYETKRRQANRSGANGGDHNVSVTIRKIEHRQVTVSVNGQDYVLKVGMAL